MRPPLTPLSFLSNFSGDSAKVTVILSRLLEVYQQCFILNQVIGGECFSLVCANQPAGDVKKLIRIYTTIELD
jgi:hypothetical protein